jgi:lysophospholipase L1-like esterase
MIKIQPNQTLLFDGDSLTCLRSSPTLDQWPWLRITNNHRSWSDVFSELLFAWRPDLNLTFRTAAVGGSRCIELEERFDRTVRVIKPDLIFMTLGSNDATSEVPLERFETILRAYIESIRKWNARLVLLYNVQACVGANERNQQKEILRRPYYAVEERLAQSYDHVSLVDIGTPLKEQAALLHRQYDGHLVYSDGTHLSHLGAIIVAGTVLKACGILADL